MGKSFRNSDESEFRGNRGPKKDADASWRQYQRGEIDPDEVPERENFRRKSSGKKHKKGWQFNRPPDKRNFD